MRVIYVVEAGIPYVEGLLQVPSVVTRPRPLFSSFSTYVGGSISASIRTSFSHILPEFILGHNFIFGGLSPFSILGASPSK